MKVWRFAFAFDPARQAVLLCGGAKQGMSQPLFYRRLVETADRRYADWLEGSET
ncbi:type II toxin-antitoxin system RelE/ParE family toxin [Gellertiella hungarica]|uniref:type II toxin-antitoxin system RelE/ParE family toxin n=1 Tax=Gellertiella hungarica TaxID=1572859 RepID=UPI0016135303|nr:type II toxin-antitoxin system RelE/ParE family toxin [Gellertiella hungarica]